MIATRVNFFAISFLALGWFATNVFACDYAVASEAQIRFDQKTGSVIASGLPASELTRIQGLNRIQRSRSLVVRVAGDSGDSDGILGKVTVADQQLIFKPRFPFRAGITYKACLAASFHSAKTEATFKIAKKQLLTRSRVTEIFPSGDKLPQNLLRVYIHFSHPMSRGEAYKRIHLFDLTQKKAVEHAFLELGEELWDPDGKRFTLLLDPGRIKKGLVPHEEDGPILIAGHRYELRVDASWLDANRRPLVSDAVKSFQATTADTQQPLAKNWKITSVPSVGSLDAVELTFDEPLDRGMLERVITLRNSGNKFAGQIAVRNGEMKWQFAPQQRWQAGHYEIVCDSSIEDRVGNNLWRPFEVDLQHGQRVPSKKTAPARIPFTVHAAGKAVAN